MWFDVRRALPGRDPHCREGSVQRRCPRMAGVERILAGSGVAGALEALAKNAAVVLEQYFTPEQCATWAVGVHRAREAWTHDFGGEQFSLGRAFYTHYEEGKSALYFDDARASDERVERCVPGLQRTMLSLVAEATGGGRVVPRRGWCGPGVHVFPPGQPVSLRGGVAHFDTEGLPARHVAASRAAITFVAMLDAPSSGGGLKVWDVRYAGHDHPTEVELAASSAVVPARVGDVTLIDSYRLHQIQPFGGAAERISVTVHAAETDAGTWETWF